MNPDFMSESLNNAETLSFADRFRIWASDVAFIIDRYLRDDETRVACYLNNQCPNKGEDYLHSIHKRCLDLLITVPVTIVVVPGIILFGIVKVLEDGGTMFYVQERVIPGTGDTLGVIKLRSMCEESDLGRDLSLNAGYSEKYDPRVTPFGKILRRFKLDELPQLLQVLVGDLSLIGLRIPPQYVLDYLKREWVYDKFERWFELYNRQCRAGVSGLNQLLNKHEKDDLVRFRLDAFYINNASLGLDMYLLWRTFLHVLELNLPKKISLLQ